MFSKLSSNQESSSYLFLNTQNYCQFLKNSFANFVIFPVIWVSQLRTWREPCTSTNWTAIWRRRINLICPLGFLAHHLGSSQIGSLLEQGILEYFCILLSNSEKRNTNRTSWQRRGSHFNHFIFQERFGWGVAQISPLMSDRDRPGFLSSDFSSQGILYALSSQGMLVHLRLYVVSSMQKP